MRLIGDDELMLLTSRALDWRGLSIDLHNAVGYLEERARAQGAAEINNAILLSVARDLRSIQLEWCDVGCHPVFGRGQRVCLNIGPLPETTDELRTGIGFADPVFPPNASIDRAVSKVAAEMLSWSKDPETFELIEHQRFCLFLRWPGGLPEPVYEYAYGAWDE